MRIVRRLSDIVSATLNELVETYENPELLLKQAKGGKVFIPVRANDNQAFDTRVADQIKEFAPNSAVDAIG